MDKMQEMFSGWNKYFAYIMYIIFKKNNYLNRITLSDGTTKLLDLLLKMSDCDEFSNFLQNLANVNVTVPLNSRFWPGYTILHLAVSMTDSAKLWTEFFDECNYPEELYSILKVEKLIKKKKLQYEESIDFSSGLELSNSTEEEGLEYQKRIDVCLQRDCIVDIMNSDGQTPIHLAFKLHKTEIIDLLLNKCQNDVGNPNDLSLFQIACTTGNVSVVKRLISRGADINGQTRVRFEWPGLNLQGRKYNLVTVPVNSTALHLAATFHNKEVVDLLVDKGADIYAKNALGLTPIHLSIGKQRDYVEGFRSIAELLLKKATNLTETLNNDSGISYLHVAAYANDTDVIKKLLQMGINIDTIFEAKAPELSHLANMDNRTPLHVALDVWSLDAIEVLVKSGADITKQTPDIMTPLQMLVLDYDDHESSAVRRYIINQLRCDKRINESIDVNGVKLLHVACHLYDFEWAKELLEKGADVNAQILDDRKDCYDWTGWTPMHFLVHIINWNIEGDGEVRNRFVKLLMDYGTNPLLTIDYEGESPLLLAHDFAREDPGEENYEIFEEKGEVLLPIADLLLNNQPSYKINPANKDGFSHFHYACTRNQVDIVKKYLDNGIDVNLTANVQYGNQLDGRNSTPLNIALYNRSLEVARLLVERGANVNTVNEDMETPLHIAIMRGLIDFHLFEMMIRNGADINACTVYGTTPVTHLLELSEITIEQLKTLRTLGFSINIANNKYGWALGLAMRLVKSSDKESLFKQLIKLWDIKNAVKYNYNYIADIVSVPHNGELTFRFYVYAIRRFIHMGCNLDWKNEKGETALYQAAVRCNLKAVKVLLLLGADINIIAKNNKPAIGTSFLVGKRRTRIKSMLAAHVWKMKYLGLKVHRLCEAAMLKILRSSPLGEDLKRRCDEELASLSKENIGESLSIRSFLHEWSAVIDYPSMSLFLREKVDQFFANSVSLRQRFPELSGLLMMQYRKAVARIKLFKKAVSMLPLVIRFNLPYLCLVDVLQYFDNDDLEHFIEGHRDLSLTYFQSSVSLI